MRRLPALALAGLLVPAVVPALTATPAAADSPVCARRGEYVDFLKRNRNETQEKVEVVSERTVLEFFVSPAGTWTVLTTSSTGLSCLARTGEGLAKFAAL